MTPEAENLLTAADELVLARLRTKRFYEAYPELEQCIVFSSCLESKVLFISPDAESLALLYQLLPELGGDVYVIFGAETICFRFQQALVYQAPTRVSELSQAQDSGTDLDEEITLISNNVSHSKDLPIMATSTTVAPETSGVEIANPQSVDHPKASRSNLQKLENLEMLAKKAGIDLDFAIQRFQSLNLFVGVGTDEQIQTTCDAWIQFADNYAANITQNLKSLLGVPSSEQLMTTPPEMMPTKSTTETMPESNGKAPRRSNRRTTTTTRKETKPKQKVVNQPRQTAKAKQPKEITASTRFRNFHPSHSAERTIGKFLEAQGLDDSNRIQIIESIAAAPETLDPEQSNTVAENVLEKIERTCKDSGNRISRLKLIQAAKGMMSKAS